MGIFGRLKSVSKIGKSYYFYATLYCTGIIGILIITYFRFELLAEVLNLDNWVDVMYLLGTLLSLPILCLMFLKKITRTLAITAAGIMSIVVFIVYWISTSQAETFIEALRNLLAPFLAAFFIYSAITSMIYVWQKVKSR